LARKETSACAETTRCTAKVAGNGAGSGANGSAAATVATVQRPSAVARIRVSPRVVHHFSSRAWASSTVTWSGSVRQNRCAATWLAFSTTPLRLPRRAGQGLIVTP